MKLKKIIVLFTTVCILGGLVACGKDTANEVNEENTNIQNDEIVTGDESNDDVASDSEQITMEALMEHEVTPASDFVCMGDETTGAIISRYEGTDEIVVIPDSLNELSSIWVTLDGIVIDFNVVVLKNAYDDIFSIPFGIV